MSKAWFAACKEGNVDGIKQGLKQKENLDAVDGDGNTGVHLAVGSRNADAVQVLIEAGADTNIVANNGWVPLLSALETDQVRVALMLIDGGANINYVNNSDGFTPLNWAIQRGLDTVCEKLLSLDVDVEHKDRVGLRPLFSAVQFGRLAAVRGLVDKGADVTAKASGFSLIGMAAHNNQPAIFDYLLSNDTAVGAVTKFDRIPLLVFAARQNSAFLVQYAMGLNIKQSRVIDEVNSMGENPLVVATDARQREAETQLVMEGANPFQPDQLGRDFRPVGRLIDGVVVRDDTADQSHRRYVLDLYKDQINSGTQDPYLRTPIFVAVRYGDARLHWIRDFHACGANINFQDKEGWTPIFEAAYYATASGTGNVGSNHIESLRLLISLGADFNAVNFRNETPLMVAIATCRKTYYKKLLRLYKSEAGPRGLSNLFHYPAQARALWHYTFDRPQDTNPAVQELIKAGAETRTSLPNKIKYAFFVLGFGLFFPWLLVSGTISNLTASEVILRMRTEILKPRFGTVLSALVLLAMLAVPPFLPAGRVMQTTGMVIAALVTVFLAIVLYRVYHEPRFTRLKAPKNNVTLSFQPGERLRSWKNLLQIGLLIYEFFVLSAFNYIPNIGFPRFPFPESSRFGPTDFIKAFSLLDLDLYYPQDFGVEQRYYTSYFTFVGVVLVWHFFASYLGASIYVLRSGNQTPNTRWVEQPLLRRTFPFIDKHFFVNIPLLDVVVPVITNALFIATTNAIFRTMDCTCPNGVAPCFMDSVPSIQCYTGVHAAMFTSGVLATILYFPTAVYIGLFFLERDSVDIVFIGRFLMLQRVVQMAMVLSSVLATSQPLLVITVTFFGNLLMFAYHITLRPCHHIGVMNWMRSAALLMAAWTSIPALLSYMAFAEKPQVLGFLNITLPIQLPFILLIVGMLLIFIGFASVLLRPNGRVWVHRFIYRPDEAANKERQKQLLAILRSNPVSYIRRNSRTGAPKDIKAKVHADQVRKDQITGSMKA